MLRRRDCQNRQGTNVDGGKLLAAVSEIGQDVFEHAAAGTIWGELVEELGSDLGEALAVAAACATRKFSYLGRVSHGGQCCWTQCAGTTWKTPSTPAGTRN